MRRPPEPPPAHRLAKYGLSREQWTALWCHQGGRCFICRKSFTPGRRACVDHNHRTGHARGLLCATCNALLGGLNEDVGWLRNAAEYLSFPPADQVLDAPAVHESRREPQ